MHSHNLRNAQDHPEAPGQHQEVHGSAGAGLQPHGCCILAHASLLRFCVVPPPPARSKGWGTPTLQALQANQSNARYTCLVCGVVFQTLRAAALMAVTLTQLAACGRKCAMRGTESMWEAPVSFLCESA